MSLSKLFSKEPKSSNESSARSSKMNRGREVLRGKLWMRKSKNSKRQLAEVIVYSASHDGKIPGQIEIFEEVNKIYQKPKKVIPLTDIAQPGVQGGSPCPSLSSSPAAQSPRNSLMGTSPSYNSSITLWPFQIITKTEAFDFYAETMEDQKQWLKRLGLLVMFPYSPIPEEPTNSPIKEQFKARLKPTDFNADSVWAVYILPEEVGSRIHLLGINILTLKSGTSDGQTGQLQIISPTDPTTPILTWDRDKMRRTGCLGNMVFIEIGRRCKGGPGLVWMYPGPKETAALRETLHMFLFKGDGRAVPISAHPQPSDHSRASFDSGFPSSYSKRNSQSSLQRSPSINTPQRQNSMDYNSQHGSDSGHPVSPFVHSSIPPPVDMDSHPNRLKMERSAPRNISMSRSNSQYENMSDNFPPMSNRSSSRRSSCRESTSDSCLFEFDQDKSSPSPDEDEKFPAGSLEPDGGHGVLPPSRHYSIPVAPPRPLLRSHSTSTCQPSQRSDEYERMINPKNSINKDGYVFMQPANGPESALQQLKNSSESSTPSPCRSSSLYPITEDRSLNGIDLPDGDESDYVNLPFALNIKEEEFTYYETTYENVHSVRERLHQRREEESGPPAILHRSNSCSSRKETVIIGERLKSVSPPHSHNIRIVQTNTSYSPDKSRNSPSPVVIGTPPSN